MFRQVKNPFAFVISKTRKRRKLKKNLTNWLPLILCGTIVAEDICHTNHRQKLESPPAWTQEAYRPLCSKYSLCCPNWVPPGGYPVRYPPGGYPDPPGGVPSQVPPRGGVPGPPRGYPVRYPRGGTRSGTPGGVPRPPPPGGGTRSGTPPGGYPVRYPPGGYPDPPSPPCGQTNTCENSTFPSRAVMISPEVQ